MASETTIKVGLDPQDVIASLKRMQEEAKNLQGALEESLSKKGSEAINDLKDNAEKGTNEITKFFSNLATRVKSDLKSAFDVSAVLAGANFAKQLGEGVKQVMDMEKAFERLNVRMGLGVQQMASFKIQAGRATSEAGLNIKDVTPGLMAAASRGNVKDANDMTTIAGTLAQAKRINPDIDTAGVTNDIAEILKRQHIKMTGTTFTQTMDAINGATANGGFSDSSQAAHSIANIAPYAQQLGLSTRSMAGLASAASRAGDSGENTLMQLLHQGTQEDGGQRLNALFGTQLFRGGKIDTTQLGKINTDQLGDIPQASLEKITGISGASGADLKILIETMRENMGDFDKVVKGTNETADQFGLVSQSWADKIDFFKSRLTNAGREIGDSIAEMASGITNKSGTGFASGAGHLIENVSHNAGDLAIGGALTIGAGVLMGGGIRGLMGSAAASAAGTQKVYVTNAAEIKGDAGGVTGLLGKIPGVAAAGGLLGRMGGALKTLGGASVGDILAGNLAGSAGASMALAGAGVLGAGAAGVGVGMGINKLTGNDKGGIGEWLYNLSHGDEANGRGGTNADDTEKIKKAFLDAMREHDGTRPKVLTNASTVKGQNG